MPRLSDRQRSLKQLKDIADLFLLLDIVDAEDDTELLEIAMMLHESIASQRYIDRPLRYNMRAAIRAARIELILNYDDRHFRQEARMSKMCFWRLNDLLKDNPVFSNASYRYQDPTHHQLLVTLFRLGKYGNGSGVGHTASYFALGDGTTEIYTWRCLKAIYDMRSKYITWPNAAERSTIAARIAHNHIFGGCVGMLDGSLVPIQQDPVSKVPVTITPVARASTP